MWITKLLKLNLNIKLKTGGDMKIACLGWGSLIWNQQSLKGIGKWFEDGPLLPIEFARQSADGRITLVIEENSNPIRTLWILMSSDNIDDAIESLRLREGTVKRHIHFQKSDLKPENNIKKIIYQWLKEKNLDYAIWTGLPPKFKNKDNVVPTKDELFKYFENVNNKVFENSTKYVRNTPKQIDTIYRRELERKFNWK